MRLTQLGQLVTHVSLEGGGNLWKSPLSAQRGVWEPLGESIVSSEGCGNLWKSPLSAQRGVGTSGRVHCQLRGVWEPLGESIVSSEGCGNCGIKMSGGG